MPYNPTTKRISIDTSTDPDTGVNLLADIKACLAENSNDTGTLCRSSRVNAMSKYKPVERASIVGKTGKTANNDYWKGDNGQCGLTIPNDIKNNWASFMAGTTAWSRALPSTWYRLLDFDGYDGSGAVTLNASKIPTGHLAEDNLSTITFNNGCPVFHLTLNAQDGTGYFLTAAEIGVKFGSSIVQLTTLIPRLMLRSTDGTIHAELKSGEWKRKTEHGADPEESDEKTLGEIISSGVSQITFSSEYEFEISQQDGTGKTVYGGDIYSDGSNQFIVTDAEFSDNRGYMTKIKGYRKSGSGSVPQSGTLSKVSGDGSSSINYYNFTTLNLNTGSKQFYVFPFLTNDQYMCGMGQNAHQMTIKSVTNTLLYTLDNIVWSKSGTTVTFTATCTFLNGYDSAKQVDVLMATDKANNWNELEPDLSDPEVTKPSETIQALETKTIIITGTVTDVDNNTYSGVAVGYRMAGTSGFLDGEEWMFDGFGNRIIPNV